MKKPFLFLLSTAALSMFLSACGQQGSSNDESTSSSSSEVATSSESTSTEETSSESTASESTSKSEGDIWTTAEIKAAEVNTPVTAELTLLALHGEGFYGRDSSGVIFVYTGGSDGLDTSSYPLGSVLKVSGYASIYCYSHQISSLKDDEGNVSPVVIEQISGGPGYASVEYQKMSIADIYDADNEDISFYGKSVKVRGRLIQYATGYTNKPYAIKDSEGNIVYVARTNFPGVNPANNVGKYVELKGFIYAYDASSFLLSGTYLTPLEAEDCTDAEAVDAAKCELLATLDGLKTKDDLTLPTSFFGASIRYASNHPEVLDATGKVISPEEQTLVTLTATVTRGEVSSSVALNITVHARGVAKIVINEVYTGGGNANAVYSHDFVELYNQTNADIDLSTYSIQYSKKAGTSFTAYSLAGTIKAHDYFLIRGNSSSKDPDSLPQLPGYDCDTSLQSAIADFTIALADTATPITVTTEGNKQVITSSNVVDLVGAGIAKLYEGTAASAPSSTRSLQRMDKDVDTDNNKEDFVTATPTPMASSAEVQQ